VGSALGALGWSSEPAFALLGALAVLLTLLALFRLRLECRETCSPLLLLVAAARP